jgi:hypothetical protein
MIFNKEKSHIWCKDCNKLISIDPCEFMIYNDAIVCFFEHHLGYYWDLFPCRFLFEGNWCLKQNKITNCNGKEEGCPMLGERE